ncbi:MAG: hypothetical protein LBL21_01675 [Rickettsiales bacterium]|jgi:hypothetical protein|nr:hypothetical protein [Rickettsiales bacterium]
MKKIMAFFSVAAVCAGAAGAKYDAFKSEAKSGLDYTAAESMGRAPDGELGKTVYSEKVRESHDVFIPTTNYVRLGAGANLGLASTLKYDWGLAEQFGVGWNFVSFARGELGWSHSDMRFGKGKNADLDTANLTLIFDLARRHVMRGDVMYRRRLIPFFGVGGAAGYADFNSGGGDGWTYGAHGIAGLAFAFTETNAVDFTFSYDYLFGHRFGWGADSVKKFRNASVSVSWRSSF